MAGVFDLAAKEKEVKKLEGEISSPDFWLASQRSGRNRAMSDEKIKVLGQFNDLIARYKEIEKTIAELKESFDESKFYEVKNKFRKFELEQLFVGQYDRQAVMLSVYPGAGGEDAGDWAKILAEMYQNYAEKRGWKIKLIDDNPRSRTVEIKGEYAYGYMKYESGVHRLVRISPFSAKKLRHTSFALVDVVPDIPSLEESKLQIPDQDLRVEFFRSGGPGGQNVNKVETAVRIVHIPTNLVASSQAERSQAQNREKALKFLKAKIFHLMRKNQVDEISSLRVSVKPEWGHQIRSYVLNPYQLVKDHRTNVETGNVESVLEGGIDMFIEAEIENLSKDTRL